MNDLIGREDAIIALLEKGQRSRRYKLGETWELNFDEIREALATVPPAEPQWIPVSEGLPKKDGRYQVTRHDYVTNTEFIDILWYEENLWWNRHSTGNYAVTAWMPLPKPYKGDKE